MIVYIVRKIIDHEYGNRNIEAVFRKKEDAEAYIKLAGGSVDGEPRMYKFWNGREVPLYTTEEHPVRP